MNIENALHKFIIIIIIGPGRTGLDHGSDHGKKKNLKKKIQTNQIVYELVVIN